MKNPLNHLKVLIVEDDKDICDLYAITFMRKGFTVYTAPDGAAAIEKFHKKKPDIVLLDIMMPNVDGYDVLKDIRKDVTKYVPVIMLTNLDSSHFTRHAEFGDVDAYLIKSHHSPSEVAEKTIEVLKVNKLLPETVEV